MRPPSRAQAWMVTFTALVLIAVLNTAPQTQSQPSTSSAPASPRSDSFDELYQRGHQASAGITTLTARFTETTTSSLLVRPLVARGTLAVQRPSRVVMRFTEPEQRVILIEGDKMTVSWPSRNLRQVSNVSSTQRRIQKYLADESVAELRRQFEIDMHMPSERAGTHEVGLVPKRKQIRDVTKRLDLWVDSSSLALSALRITFGNGDTKTMEFEDVKLNAPLEPGAFTIDR